MVQWVRHGRNVATDPAARLDDYNGRIHAEWNEPLGMVATLYKVSGQRRRARGARAELTPCGNHAGVCGCAGRAEQCV